MCSNRFRARLLIMAIMVVASIVAVFLEAPEHPAYAMGSGRVCVFFAPTGAPSGSLGNYLGHVGWAVRVGSKDDWLSGAMEGTGDFYIFPGDYNGSWVTETNWDTVKNLFGRALYNVTTSHRYHAHFYYTEYRCRNTDHSSLLAVHKLVDNAWTYGYSLPEGDCLTEVTSVIERYDSSIDVGDINNSNESGGLNRVFPVNWFSYVLDRARFEPVVKFSPTSALEQLVNVPTEYADPGPFS